MKQTAVEWLIGQLYAPCRGIPSHIIEQAKEMEKEQMCQFANAWDKELSDGVIRSVEDCFEATFKTNEK
jgi:hypothetical protein